MCITDQARRGTYDELAGQVRDAGDEGGWVDELGGGDSVFAPDDGVDLFGLLLAWDLNICIDVWKERQAPNWQQVHFRWRNSASGDPNWCQRRWSTLIC